MWLDHFLINCLQQGLNHQRLRNHQRFFYQEILLSVQQQTVSNAKNGVETLASNFRFRQVKFRFCRWLGLFHCACPSHHSHCPAELLILCWKTAGEGASFTTVIVFTAFNYVGWGGGWKNVHIKMADSVGFRIKIYRLRPRSLNFMTICNIDEILIIIFWLTKLWTFSSLFRSTQSNG